MASIIMHIAIAKELYPKLKDKININYKEYILGSIAPDLSKLIGESKKESHFTNNESEIPNMDLFLKKYGNTLNNSFNLGYYIHLYTDKLFYVEFLPLFIQDDIISSTVKFIKGDILQLSLGERKDILYNDYTNLNIQIINEYNLSLDIFYDNFEVPNTNIKEIDKYKLNILIDNAGIIIENSTKNKEYIIDISRVKSFINNCIEEIYSNLLSLEIL